MLPNLRVPGYPYSKSGEFFGDGPERRHEQLTAAAFIAASVALCYRVKRYGEAVTAKASDGQRRLFSGNDVEIIADLRALRDRGAAAIGIDFERADPEGSIAEMRRFQDQVIALL